MTSFVTILWLICQSSAAGTDRTGFCFTIFAGCDPLISLFVFLNKFHHAIQSPVTSLKNAIHGNPEKLDFRLRRPAAKSVSF